MVSNMDSVRLALKSSVYTDAVTQLDSKLKLLNQARTDYDTQRREIPNFWSGDEADEAYETIGENIENVKKAYQAVEDNMKAFQEAEQQAGSVSSEVKQKLQEERKKVQSLFQS